MLGREGAGARAGARLVHGEEGKVEVFEVVAALELATIVVEVDGDDGEHGGDEDEDEHGVQHGKEFGHHVVVK